MSTSDCYPEKRKRADELLTALSDLIRREIIHYYENHAEEPNSGIDELASHIADRMPAERQKHLLLKLPQTQLPKLEFGGWLSYNKQTGRVIYNGNDDANQLLTDVRDMF